MKKSIKHITSSTLAVFILAFILVTQITYGQQDEDITANEVKRTAVLTLVEKVFNGDDTTDDAAVLETLLAENFVNHAVEGDMDAEALVAHLNGLRAAMPDLTVNPDVVLAGGDLAAARLTYRGTFTERLEANGELIEPNGEVIEWGHNVIYHFDEAGRIVEVVDSYDRLSYLAQIGDSPLTPLVASLIDVTRDNVAIDEPIDAADPEIIEASIEQIVAALNAGSDLDDLAAVLAEDFISYQPFSDLDSETFVGAMALFHATAPDLVVTSETLLIEGNWVAVRLVYAGTFANPIDLGLVEVPATEKPFLFKINVIARFDEKGLLEEDWREFNSVAWLQQAGVLPVEE